MVGREAYWLAFKVRSLICLALRPFVRSSLSFFLSIFEPESFSLRVQSSLLPIKHRKNRIIDTNGFLIVNHLIITLYVWIES